VNTGKETREKAVLANGTGRIASAAAHTRKKMINPEKNTTAPTINAAMLRRDIAEMILFTKSEWRMANSEKGSDWLIP